MEFFTETQQNVQYNCSTNINFYYNFPTSIVSLEQLSSLAIQRLKVLRVIEEVTAMSTGKSRVNYITELERIMALRHINNWREIIYGVENSKDVGRIEKEQEKDIISHFILRLAFSKTEHLRRWFITNELELFRTRLKALSCDSFSFTKFIRSNDVGYPFISATENIFPEDVRNAYFGAVKDVYILPFEDAAELVSKRVVLLHNGSAYMTQSQLMPSICSRFRSNLSQSLTSFSNSLGNLFEEDSRLLPILEELSVDYVDTSTPVNHNAIKAQHVDQLSVKHFPLCMKSIHDVLRKLHHMRHWGRMQYGLFLKAIGLPLDESLKFWRQEFTKKMEDDKFERNYAYNIRHNYGKEGRRADYTPHSCMRIISSIGPSAGDCNGCPFRHYDVNSLREELKKKGIEQTWVNKILDKVNNNHYQVACGLLFAADHGGDGDLEFIPTQPSDYFHESVKRQQ